MVMVVIYTMATFLLCCCESVSDGDCTSVVLVRVRVSRRLHFRCVAASPCLTEITLPLCCCESVSHGDYTSVVLLRVRV